jgi:hypothetical protein
MISEVQEEQLQIVLKFDDALNQHIKFNDALNEHTADPLLPTPLEHHIQRQERLRDEIAVLLTKAGETFTAARITFMF